MKGGERWNTRAAILFRSKPLRLQGIRGKYVSLRTIAQDLTSFSKTVRPFWLLVGHAHVIVSIFQLVGIFTPSSKTGWIGASVK
jgi:hypothetical protein